MCTDAFLTEWREGNHVPSSFSLIGPGLAKLKEDKTTLILIVPAWQGHITNRYTNPTITNENTVRPASEAFRNKQPTFSPKARDVGREQLTTAWKG